MVLNALRRQCDLDATTGRPTFAIAWVLNALRRQCDLDLYTVIDSSVSLKCSTPYGDNAIWTRDTTALRFVQAVLNALRRQCDLDPWTSLRFHVGCFVLNALRRQCDLDACSHRYGQQPVRCAQRLTATMRFGLGSMLSIPTLETACSTPYGDNAIWTLLADSPILPVKGAQRLTATMRFGLISFAIPSDIEEACSTPYGDNAIWTTRGVERLHDNPVCSTPYGDNAIWTPRLVAGLRQSIPVLNALRRQCDLDGPVVRPTGRQ